MKTGELRDMFRLGSFSPPVFMMSHTVAHNGIANKYRSSDHTKISRTL